MTAHAGGTAVQHPNQEDYVSTALTSTIQYVATHIEPNTPYPDELEADMPTGWHIVGYTANDTAAPPDPDDAVVVVSIDYALDPDTDQIHDEDLARRIAELLNTETAAYPASPKDWLARTGGLRGVEICPSCAPDGGYGLARPEWEYVCPRCLACWSPKPGADSPVRTRLGRWIQLVKVWATSPGLRRRR